MKNCCLKVADSSGIESTVGNFENVNQLYGAMRQAVEFGFSLVSLSIDDKILYR